MNIKKTATMSLTYNRESSYKWSVLIASNGTASIKNTSV